MPNHWNCFVAGCRSNWQNWIRYHCVPKSQGLFNYYKAWSKTGGIDWDKEQFICSRHWTTPRRNFKHLPDIRIPGPIDIKEKVKEKMEKARKERVQKFGLMRKVNLVAQERTGSLGVDVPVQEFIIKETSSINADSDREIKKLKQEISKLKIELEKQDDLQQEITALKMELQNLRANTAPVKTATTHSNSTVFDWQQLTDSEMENFTGFDHENIQTLFKCFQPFLHLLRYQDCVNSCCKTSKQNEFLAVMTICRHALPLSIVAWMVGVSQPTMNQIFEAWITLGDAVLSTINLKPSDNLLSGLVKAAAQVHAQKNLGGLSFFSKKTG